MGTAILIMLGITAILGAAASIRPAVTLDDHYADVIDALGEEVAR